MSHTAAALALKGSWPQGCRGFLNDSVLIRSFPDGWVGVRGVLEKPTEVREDTHGFIHVLTKHVLSTQTGAPRGHADEGQRLSCAPAGEARACWCLLRCLAFLGDTFTPFRTLRLNE